MATQQERAELHKTIWKIHLSSILEICICCSPYQLVFIIKHTIQHAASLIHLQYLPFQILQNLHLAGLYQIPASTSSACQLTLLPSGLSQPYPR